MAEAARAARSDRTRSTSASAARFAYSAGSRPTSESMERWISLPRRRAPSKSFLPRRIRGCARTRTRLRDSSAASRLHPFTSSRIRAAESPARAPASSPTGTPCSRLRRPRGVAVEIDGDPARQDLDYTLAADALAAGCIFALDSDAHTTSQLRLRRDGGRARAPRRHTSERIVNCWQLEDCSRGRRAERGKLAPHPAEWTTPYGWAETGAHVANSASA